MPSNFDLEIDLEVNFQGKKIFLEGPQFPGYLTILRPNSLIYSKLKAEIEKLFKSTACSRTSDGDLEIEHGTDLGSALWLTRKR